MKIGKFGIGFGMILALAVSAPLYADDAETEGNDTPRGVAERLRGLDVPERATEAVESASEGVSDTVGRARGGIERRMEAAQRQIEQFESVHLRRLAQLQRVRELAEEHGRIEALERVEQLIERELDRYSNQLVRLQQRLGLIPEAED